jgi:threonine/homoserine/homoserine lactone efflux protein
MIYLLYGLFIGGAIGITVGPVALLCIQRSMQHGAKAGIITGIGATIAQLVFASIALFGMHIVQPFFESYEYWVQLASSIVIFAIAMHIYRLPVAIAQPDQNSAPTNHTSALLTSFIITLSGPISIASYALFITFLELQFDTVWQSIRFLGGVALGNLAWWIPVSFASSYLTRIFDKKYLRYINKIAALLLVLLAIFGAVRAVYGFMQ